MSNGTKLVVVESAKKRLSTNGKLYRAVLNTHLLSVWLKPQKHILKT